MYCTEPEYSFWELIPGWCMTVVLAIFRAIRFDASPRVIITEQGSRSGTYSTCHEKHGAVKKDGSTPNFPSDALSRLTSLPNVHFNELILLEEFKSKAVICKSISMSRRPALRVLCCVMWPRYRYHGSLFRPQENGCHSSNHLDFSHFPVFKIAG